MKFSTLKRLYVDVNLAKNQTIRLDDEYTHYLKNVLRAKNFDLLRLFNKNGEFLGRIHNLHHFNKRINKKQDDIIDIEILELLRLPRSELQIILAMPLIKTEKMSEAINMAVQLGVTKIVPIKTKFSQTEEINYERFSRIILEAVRQSERFALTKLEKITTLENFILNYSVLYPVIFANEREIESNSIRSLSNMHDIFAKNGVCIMIGPEGGFSDQEHEMLLTNQNIHSISLGTNILRTETAVATLLSQLQLYNPQYNTKI